MNTLHIMVGLPRSGKSTEAMATGIPVVNPDSIRLALHGNAFIPEAEQMVWTIAKYMVKALFIAGHTDVILDATNITKARRSEWKSKQWNRKYQYIDTPKEVCLARAEGNENLKAAIERMAAQYEPISEDEVD